MRNPKRIPILLDIYSRESVKESYLKNVVGLAQKSDIKKYLTKWTQKEEAGVIEQTWQENPNFRTSEILIESKVVPSFSGDWKYMEDEKFLKDYGIADERMTTVWNLKDGDLEERGVPIKNISDRDLAQLKESTGDDFPAFLEKEIEYREVNRIKVVELGNPYYQLDID